MHTQIDTRLEELRRQVKVAEEEAAGLRPRLQYLTEMLLRLDGAMTVLMQLKEAAPEPTSQNHAAPPPVAS